MMSAAVNSLPAKYSASPSLASTNAKTRSSRPCTAICTGRSAANLEIAVGEVKPVEIGREIRMVRPKPQPAAAVFEDDVFGDGRGFGQQQNVILDHRGSAERV